MCTGLTYIGLRYAERVLRVLKELTDAIAQPMAKLFENLWHLGEVPEDWKRSNVLPIYKKIKKEHPGN